MAAHQAPPSLGFSRQEHCSGLPFPSQCMKVKSESEKWKVKVKSYPTLSDPMDCSLPGSSIDRIFQARVLEWGAIAFTMPKTLTVWITTNWKILKEMGIADHFTCLLRNLYAGQEAIVWTGHGTTDWFQIGKGVHQGCVLSPCLFNLHAEYNHVKCRARCSTSWNQDFQKKYQ